MGGPTRENGNESNLDFIYTNDIALFTEIEISKSSMSDHHFIEINTSYNTSTKYVKQNKMKSISVTKSFAFLVTKLIRRIENIPWEEAGKGKDTIQYIEYLLMNINE